ncbi:MAG: bifunctional helix-turn-helix domain-containing protein/methylated-DNA--[protein]-cysteine S-methyltransferase [Minisyncoccia bacterium]
MKSKKRSKGDLYETMRDAIHYLRVHAKEHPDTATVAKALGMSVSRFNHAFTEWVGVPPKRFLSYLTKEHAKELLANSKNVLDASYKSGLSGPSRLHDLLVTHDAVSPGEFKSGEIEIRYGIHASPFGWCLLGVTPRGVCALSFLENASEREALQILKKAWPNAKLVLDNVATKPFQEKIFTHFGSKKKMPLVVHGTNFQMKVWEALLAIPPGKVASYADIARRIGSPKAVRAVGTACGKNPIAFLIPCHRVLTSEGGLGGYRWGIARKDALLAWEISR